MNLDELAQVGLNAPYPLFEGHESPAAMRWFVLGRKAATDHIIAAILRDLTAPGTERIYSQAEVDAILKAAYPKITPPPQDPSSA